MEPQRPKDITPARLPHSGCLRDEVFAALTYLTEARLAGRTLTDLPAATVDWLVGLLGEREVADLLSIDDRDLVVEWPRVDDCITR